jgi:hypothetical protein
LFLYYYTLDANLSAASRRSAIKIASLTVDK